MEGTLLAVHSLYYFTPMEICKYVNRYQRMLAVVHKFENGRNCLYPGLNSRFPRSPEGVYLNYRGNVKFQARGCGYSYKHYDLSWMYETNSYQENGSGMVWNLVTTLGHTRIYEFLPGTTESDGPELPLVMHDTTTVFKHDVPQVDVNGVLVPLKLVNEISMRALQMPKTSLTSDLLLNHARAHVRTGNYSVPLENSVAVVYSAVTFALANSARVENAVVASISLEDKLEINAYDYRLGNIPLKTWAYNWVTLTAIHHLNLKMIGVCDFLKRQQKPNHAVISELPPGTLREGASLKEVDSLKKPQFSGLHQYGPILDGVVPQRFANCRENEVVAVTQRVICEVPAYDEAEWQRFLEWIVVHFDQLFGTINGDLKATLFEIWNNRFPKNRRMQQQKAYAEYQSADVGLWLESWCVRSSFVKIEPQLGDLPESKPRLIQGVSHHANVILGPWIHSFQGHLKDLWSMGNVITYGSGRPSDVLGSWMDQNNHLNLYENDFSAFDSCVHTEALKLEQMIYELHGLDGDALKVVQAQLATVGYTAFGLRYAVNGVRCSGDPNTTSGNTMLTGLMMAYAFSVQVGYFLDPNQVRVMCCGDDAVIACSRNIDLVKVSDLLLKLGFKSKLSQKTPYTLNFCSSFFCPTSNGCVLTPLLAKSIAKVGWAVEKQKSGPEWFKGVMKQWRHVFHHIPFMFAYANSILDKNPLVVARMSENPYKFNLPSSFPETCRETLICLNELYGLTLPDVQNLVSYFSAIATDSVIQHPLVRKMCELEGLL